jgi:class 3 adenylate cyclase
MRMQKPKKVPLASIVVVSALSCTVGLSVAFFAGIPSLDSLKWRTYDRYLAFSGAKPAPGNFLVLCPESGEGPKPQSAKDTLLELRLLDEFEIQALALAGPAFAGAPEREELAALRSELPLIIDRECDTIERNIRSLFAAIRSGSIPPKELGRYVELLAGIVKAGGERLKETSGEGQDRTLQAIEAESRRLVAVDGPFAAVKADPDGVLRRLPLVKKEGDRIVPSFELAALMDRLAGPSLRLEKGRVLLLGAKFPGGATRDMAIPVDAEGRALIDWPRPKSNYAPRMLALDELREAIAEEDGFISTIERMDTGGLLLAEGSVLLSRYRYVELLGENVAAGNAAAEWREARKDFFSSALAYFQGSREEERIAALREANGSPAATDEGIDPMDSRVAEIRQSYKEAREHIESLVARRERLSEELHGSFVFTSMNAEEAPLVTSFGKRTSLAEAGAVFASAALSGNSPYILPSGARTVLVCLLIFAATGASFMIGSLFSPVRGLGSGILVGLVGGILSLAVFAAWRAFVPPLPLLLGPCAAAFSAFVLARMRFGVRRVAREKVAVAMYKAPALMRAAESASPEEAVRALRAVQKKLHAAIEGQGGIIAASDGFTVLAFFDEREGAEAPVKRALDAQAEMRGDICAGIDWGDCLIVSKAFGWGNRFKGSISGSVVDLAQRLADLDSHYGTRVLATGAALERIGEGIPRHFIGELKVESTGRKAALYSLGERTG